MSFISIRKTNVHDGNDLRFIWSRLSFYFIFAIDQSRQAEALQKRFPLATQLKERGMLIKYSSLL